MATSGVCLLFCFAGLLGWGSGTPIWESWLLRAKSQGDGIMPET